MAVIGFGSIALGFASLALLIDMLVESQIAGSATIATMGVELAHPSPTETVIIFVAWGVGAATLLFLGLTAVLIGRRSRRERRMEADWDEVQLRRAAIAAQNGFLGYRVQTLLRKVDDLERRRDELQVEVASLEREVARITSVPSKNEVIVIPDRERTEERKRGRRSAG